jgi:hypothetical protein
VLTQCVKRLSCRIRISATAVAQSNATRHQTICKTCSSYASYFGTLAIQASFANVELLKTCFLAIQSPEVDVSCFHDYHLSPFFVAKAVDSNCT